MPFALLYTWLLWNNGFPHKVDILVGKALLYGPILIMQIPFASEFKHQVTLCKSTYLINYRLKHHKRIDNTV